MTSSLELNEPLDFSRNEGVRGREGGRTNWAYDFHIRKEKYLRTLASGQNQASAGIQQWAPSHMHLSCSGCDFIFAGCSNATLTMREYNS